MFERLVWEKDRVRLDDLVFRVQELDRWSPADDFFPFDKSKAAVDLLEKFWSTRETFHPERVFELGIFRGGSVAFWFEHLRPQKHVAIDIAPWGDGEYFKRYVGARGLGERVKTYWGTDQGDSARLRQIVRAEFTAPLDLVIDDASHMYALTKKSFETLFPLLRCGGLYVIEDWCWAHVGRWQAPDSPFAFQTPLTNLILECVEAAGSSPALVAGVNVFGHFAVIERGGVEEGRLGDFKLEDHISRPKRHSLLGRGWRRLRRIRSG
ncbi:MAG TPA: class I SAM-dependent methyltransferase [bacterium]|nr:class I SAM-dependent methyltransferase [bacterium]